MATIAQDLFVYSAPWQNEAQIASLPYNDGTRGYYNAIAPPPNGIVVVLTTWHIAVVDFYVFEHAMILKQTSVSVLLTWAKKAFTDTF